MLCGAEAYAVYEQTGRPAVSVHRYGKGKAYYVAAETDSELLRWLLRGLETEIGLQPALRVPHGVQARQMPKTNASMSTQRRNRSQSRWRRAAGAY